MQNTRDNLLGELSRLEGVFSALSVRLTKAAEQFRQVGVSPAQDLMAALSEYQKSFAALANRIADYGREVSLPSGQLAKLPASTLDDLRNSIRLIAEFEEQCRREALKKAALTTLDRALAVVRRDGIDFPPLLSCQAKIRALREEILNYPGSELHPAVQEISDGKQAITCLLCLIEDEGGLTDDEGLNFYETLAQSFGKELAIAAARGKLEVRPAVTPASLESQENAPAEAPSEALGEVKEEVPQPAGQEFPQELASSVLPAELLSTPVPSTTQSEQGGALNSPAASDQAASDGETGAIPIGRAELAEKIGPADGPADAVPSEPVEASMETQEEDARLLPARSSLVPAGSASRAAYTEASQASAFSHPRLATLAGRYELREKLGKGGAGAVYKALDSQTGRTVAVKVLDADGLSAEQLRLHKARMWREASIAGEISHPGIVAVLDIDDDETGHPYIVMDFVDGGTLEQILTRSDGVAPPDLAQRLDIAIQLSRTLEYAHGHGVVHRDIKPSNILVGSDGHVKIADFGIALLSPNQPSSTAELPGTPAFIAPELLSDIPATPASDIFSLGVVLYWMFTGQMPFAGRTVTEITWEIANVEPLPARQVNWALPQELETILARCLAKNPGERYVGAALLAEDLTALRDSRSCLPERGEQFAQKGESAFRAQ